MNWVAATISTSFCICSAASSAVFSFSSNSSQHIDNSRLFLAEPVTVHYGIAVSRSSRLILCADARTCAMANCQYGCAVMKGEVKCQCPSPGLRLAPDGRTCVGADAGSTHTSLKIHFTLKHQKINMRNYILHRLYL